MADDTDAQFEAAKQWVEANNGALTDAQKLDVYGLFKQATVGDCNIGERTTARMESNSAGTLW